MNIYIFDHCLILYQIDIYSDILIMFILLAASFTHTKVLPFFDCLTNCKQYL